MTLPDDSANIYSTLKQAARQWPDNVAIFDEQGPLSFKDLYQQTETLKKYLQSIGVAPGQGIATLTKNNRNFLVSLYAGLGSGAVVMPVSPQQRPDEIQRAIAEASVHYLLTDNAAMLKFGSHVGTLQNFHVGETEKSKTEKTVAFIDDAAVMRFTSGTTGAAKCVVLSHNSIRQRIEAANTGLKLNETDRVVWVLPMAYHFIVSLMLYVRFGTGVIVCDDFLAENIIENTIRHQGTVLYASPMHIRLLAAYKKNVDTIPLRRVISTTAGITQGVCEAFKKKFGIAVSQAFGIIEIGLPILNTERSEDHPQAVGYALPAYEVAILDPGLNVLPDGDTGMLAIKGPGMFDGYLVPPTLRQNVLVNGWFLTGDLASRSSSGMIEIKGREKSVINVSGNKVFPNEVEEIIDQFPGVVRSRVYGLSHALLGEVVAADIVFPDPSAFDEEALIRHCHAMLSSFKVPHRIKLVDRIDMTGSGKIRRI